MTFPNSHLSKLSSSALLIPVAVASCVLGALLLPSTGQAHNNKVSIKVSDTKRCIISNGLPNHNTGKFPNSGNPNRIAKQNVKLCVTTNPKKGNRPQKVRGSIGVGINGVQFRPGTADYYDANSRRGHSRDRSSGWNLDGLGAREMLGMDNNNAHVDQRGLYHYHGVSNALVKSGKGSLIGWAADGFEIHYLGSKRRSGYRLRKGTRPSAPGGTYDGTYVQDWEYVGSSNSLDQCNGGMLNGNFVYFATETFPFLPHCLWGKVSNDFLHLGGGRVQKKGRKKRDGRQPQQRMASRRGPPQEAITICRGKSSGSSCTFTAPRRNQKITGRCRTVRSGTKACVPARRGVARP